MDEGGETESFVRRKKLRKGTQSCTECRRRKIRCIYPSGSSTCSPCSARGGRCKGQVEEVVSKLNIENMTLRDRVARLESIIDGVMQTLSNGNVQSSKPFASPHAGDTEDLEESWEDIGSRAPFVSVLEDAELLSPLAPSETGFSAIQTSQDVTALIPTSSIVPKPAFNSFQGVAQMKRHEEKNKKICEKLRSSLPTYDDIISTLELNGSWWCHFDRKLHPSTQISERSLAIYAKQLYTSTDAVDLGILTTAYARSTSQDHDLYALVERLIISDRTFSCTLRGLECLLLLVKSYTDLGQPRRAWCLSRRGLTIAQLMGLYRQTGQTSETSMIWISLYLSDRFTSLLLGLPYGVSDINFPVVISNTRESDFVAHPLTQKCSSIAGQILDRNLKDGKASYATTISLDEQMSTTASSMPSEWWDIPSCLSGTEPGIDHIRTQLQIHSHFYQIRSYLHLPFLIDKSTSNSYHHSKLICIESARQILRRFLVFHTTVNGEKLYECKTNDFMGFIAAAILLIGLSKLQGGKNLRLSDEDSNLISSTKSIFRESEERGCHIASQCYKTLMLLSSTNGGAGLGVESVKIPIPYFGVVVRRSILSNTHSQPKSIPASSTLPTPASINTSENPSMGHSNEINSTTFPTINDISFLDKMAWEVDEFGNLPGINSTYWLESSTFDIDQDWSMFLNENV